MKLRKFKNANRYLWIDREIRIKYDENTNKCQQMNILL